MGRGGSVVGSVPSVRKGHRF